MIRVTVFSLTLTCTGVLQLTVFLKGNEIEEDSCLQNISNFLNCLIIITHSETELTGVSQQMTVYRPFHANELSHRV